MTEIMYAKEDYVGFSSKNNYAKKGDVLMVLSRLGNMVLVQNVSQRFYINENLLSELPVLKENK